MKRINLFEWAHLPVPGPKGAFSLSAMAAHCTRCNACAQSCPAYISHREEMFSPRGRVQFIRLLAEQKIRPEEGISTAWALASTCLLCSRCSSACAGQIPTAHLMLALRQVFPAQKLPKTLQFLLQAYGRYPRLFKILLYPALAARRLGVLSLLKHTKILSLPGLDWISHAHEVLPRKTGRLKRALQKQRINTVQENIKFIYLPSPEAQYLVPSVGLKALAALNPAKTQLWLDTPSGFFEFVYGSRVQSLRQARRLLVRWEKLRENIPLVTDSIEIYAFLKNYPFLFSRFPGWQKRAERFAAQVHFIAEYITPQDPQKETTALDFSGALYPAKEAAEKAEQILKTHFRKNLLECGYSRFPLPAAAEAFLHCGAARQAVLENVKDIAQQQIKQVYCLSVWSALELEASLRRNYPAARAFHITHLQG